MGKPKKQRTQPAALTEPRKLGAAEFERELAKILNEHRTPGWRQRLRQALHDKKPPKEA